MWRRWFDKQSSSCQETIRLSYMESQMNILSDCVPAKTTTSCEASHRHSFATFKPDNIFGCKNATPAQVPASLSMFKQAICTAKQEKECAMNCTETRTEAQEQKDYLIRSLNQAIDIQQTNAVYTFNLNGPKIKTVGDLKAALENGWFQVNGDRKDDQKLSQWCSIFEYLKLEDPKNPRNEEGYEAALKLISKDAADVKDTIIVLGPEKGLEALNAFKAKTYA